MKKDIPFRKVEDVAIAIVPEKNHSGGEAWYVYLINMNRGPLETVLVVSKGYGDVEEIS